MILARLCDYRRDSAVDRDDHAPGGWLVIAVDLEARFRLIACRIIIIPDILPAPPPIVYRADASRLLRLRRDAMIHCRYLRLAADHRALAPHTAHELLSFMAAKLPPALSPEVLAYAGAVGIGGCSILSLSRRRLLPADGGHSACLAAGCWRMRRRSSAAAQDGYGEPAWRLTTRRIPSSSITATRGFPALASTKSALPSRARRSGSFGTSRDRVRAARRRRRVCRRGVGAGAICRCRGCSLSPTVAAFWSISGR